jgi:hypothetical protein
VGFRLAIEPGSLPVPFRKAVEDSARETLRQGIHGWEVTDCTVTLTHSGYVPDHNPLNRKEYLLHAARGVARRVREP